MLQAESGQPLVELSPSAGGLVDERLTLPAFSQLSGRLAGYPFVKLVVDRQPLELAISAPHQDKSSLKSRIHFLNNSIYQFHIDYIAENILNLTRTETDERIDELNHSFYVDPKRRFYLGILSLHRKDDRTFFALETVEVDTMDSLMMKYFYDFVRSHIDPAFPLFFKPANHTQEEQISEIDPVLLPRVHAHELFSSSTFIALHPGSSKGRLRVFETESTYRAARATLQWYDIIVMPRVPDDIPRLSGIINANHTTPLSHTNVLASGWGIPNAIELGILARLREEGLDGEWVEYTVAPNASQTQLAKIERPSEADFRPVWSVQSIKIEEPEITQTRILPLERLRMSDRYKFGTKAANLGELHHVLKNGSERLLGFYSVRRPPRANLLSYAASFLNTPSVLGVSQIHGGLYGGLNDELSAKASHFLRGLLVVPRGIAIPFSIQQEFLASSWKIQQMIGKLKMSIELESRQIDSLCVSLQQLIRSTRLPDAIRNYIDSEMARNLAGVEKFVVRSSSNAEDLPNFSAAGIYESVNHVSSAETIFDSIRHVWASLVSPRSVRLRQELGISLDDSYMGVVIQEEVAADMGGVLVTTNPMNRSDFRNVYLNVSAKSVESIVQGDEIPYQYLYNTVEGGGRTVSIGSARADLNPERKRVLQDLSYAGRLLQAHFSPDYTFARPVDIEWMASGDQVSILQLRPYSQ